MKKLMLICFQLVLAAMVIAQNSCTLINKGVRQANKGNYAKAIELFTQALEADPYYSDAWYNRALIRSYLREYSRAIDDYTRAINLRPNFTMAYNNRGTDKNELKDYAGAIEDYTRAIGFDSGYAKAWYNRGIARMHLYDYEKAVSDSHVFRQSQGVRVYPDLYCPFLPCLLHHGARPGLTPSLRYPVVAVRSIWCFRLDLIARPKTILFSYMDDNG